MKISREQLIEGKNYAEDVYFEELGGELNLRSLTDIEYEKIKRKRASAIKTKVKTVGNQEQSEVNINTNELLEATHESNIMAVCYGVVFDKPLIRLEVIETFKVGMVEKIAKEIYRITGVNPDGEFNEVKTQKEVEQFRTDNRG